MATPSRPTASAAVLSASPRTPQRGISSTFSSPGFRTEEDTIIFEIGTRYFKAGLANDSTPRCVLEYGPEQSRRLGDYRKWLPEYDTRATQLKSFESWTRDYELWQPDVRTFDLGLMEDKIERAVRLAFSKYLLLDAKGRKVVLVAPALIPHTVLSKILTILFHNFQISNVTLLPPPTMAVVASGQRSGLVIDIGWHETIVTAVYEFREVLELRSTRAMKTLHSEASKMFSSLHTATSVDSDNTKQTNLDFQSVEEFISQLMWCRTSSKTSSSEDEKVHIPVRLTSSTDEPISIPFSELDQIVEKALFAKPASHREQDDEEHALDYLLYKALVRLPQDIRSVCMSRITFTGGGANIPGIKSRLVNDLESMVSQRGWSYVWQSKHSRKGTESQSTQNLLSTSMSNLNTNDTPEGAAYEEQVQDPLEKKLLEAAAKESKPQIQGEIRFIETMGAFAGASLTTALHVKGLVEIERDIWLQHGFSGPRKEQEPSARNKSIGGGLAKLPTSDSSTWTLGAWA